MRQRVGMAQAVLNKPKVLVLDEPSAYLDEREENLFYELAGEFFQNRIVIITERSSLDETRSRCEEVADWNLTMKNGKVGSIQNELNKCEIKIGNKTNIVYKMDLVCRIFGMSTWKDNPDGRTGQHYMEVYFYCFGNFNQ